MEERERKDKEERMEGVGKDKNVGEEMKEGQWKEENENGKRIGIENRD